MNNLKTIVVLFGIALALQGAAFAKSLNSSKIDPAGLWLASKKQDVVVEIKHCDDGLCGQIHWLAKGENQSLCAEKVLWGFKQSQKNQNLWENGTIYEADDKTHFSGNLSFISANKLNLRGYLGLPIFGKSYEFERVTHGDYNACLRPDELASNIN